MNYRVGFLFIGVTFYCLVWNTLPTYAQRSSEEWTFLLNRMRVKIGNHYRAYPSKIPSLKGNVSSYLQGADALANDRDECLEYAQEAQSENMPAFFHEFMSLVEDAQNGANLILDKGSSDLLIDENDLTGNLRRVDFFGRPLYKKAIERSLDEEIARAGVARLLTSALEQVQGKGRSNGIFTSDGGGPDPEVEKNLKSLDGLRRSAQFFSLPEIDVYAKEVMNEYLEKALCLKKERAHDWYAALADKFGLEKSKEYIQGFYGTIQGKVTIETSRGTEAVEGARIVISEPRGEKKWEGISSADGMYEIKDVLLHDRCGPFPIQVIHQQDRLNEEYSGPLKHPSKDYIFSKDLKFKIADGLLSYEYKHEGAGADGQFINTCRGHDKIYINANGKAWGRGAYSGEGSASSETDACSFTFTGEYKLKGKLVEELDNLKYLTWEPLEESSQVAGEYADTKCQLTFDYVFLETRLESGKVEGTCDECTIEGSYSNGSGTITECCPRGQAIECTNSAFRVWPPYLAFKPRHFLYAGKIKWEDEYEEDQSMDLSVLPGGKGLYQHKVKLNLKPN